MQLQHKFHNIKFSKNVSKKKKLIDSNTSLLDLIHKMTISLIIPE